MTAPSTLDPGAVLGQALRERATQAADRLSEHLALPPSADPDSGTGPRSRRWWDQSLSKGAAGVAVLHGVRAQQQLSSDEHVAAWLHAAVREDISAAPGCGLWFGVPAVAFAVHIAAPDRYRYADTVLHASVETLVARRLQDATDRRAAGVPSRSEFDLVRGLTGLGAYLMLRDPDSVLFREVLVYLVGLTEPVPVHDVAGPDVPGWWTSDIPGGRRAAEFSGGHADLGMAHGISGPLALLALAMRHGTTVPGQAEAIERICAFLDAWGHGHATARWWPQRVTLTDLRGSTTASGPSRPSWCYGTPGMARAQQLAALALHDTRRQLVAENALLHAVLDQRQLDLIVDPGMCHGWAGVAATLWCAARDSPGSGLTAALPSLTEALLTAAAAPAVTSGLIDGTAGVALTLHGLATATLDGWTRCLLLT